MAVEPWTEVLDTGAEQSASPDAASIESLTNPASEVYCMSTIGEKLVCVKLSA